MKKLGKELACIVCLECHKEVCGTSELQAKAMMKEHRKSKNHKVIVEALKRMQSSGAIMMNKTGGNKS